jgi:hypothetical protein
MSGLIPLIKLILDAGVFSPVAPTTFRERFGKEPTKPNGTPPSSGAGMRPECGLGKKAVLVNDAWVCIPSFK